MVQKYENYQRKTIFAVSISNDDMKKRFFLEKDDRKSICRVALCVSVFFMVLAGILLVETFLFPVLNERLRMEIMARNLTTVAALVTLSLYLGKWSNLYSEQIPVSSNMKSYKFLTVLAAIFSLIKTVVSFIFSIIYLMEGNMVGIYFGGETIAWIALALFFILYSGKLFSDRDFIIKDVHHHLS